MSPEPARSDAAQRVMVRTIADLRAAVARWRTAECTVGLVPTMGGLHDGHLALVRQARAECDRVVATIFVNPTQFNEQADFNSYPRDEARDAAGLKAAGADLLFAPSAEGMYPVGFATTVAVSGLTDCLCGVSRPGHFTGVSTVVAKLLLQALPDVAYFGEKDYQQYLVIRRMTRDLDIPVRIAAVATVRAADGFALSSRNQLLTPEQRHRAAALFQVLSDVAERLSKGAPAQPELARGRAALIEAGFGRIDYLDLRHGETLAALERAEAPARLFAAVWLGETRLIDNVPVV